MSELLRIQHISKQFPGVKALDDVSFEVCAGEVHALMGENGAGKSTLIKILTGIYTRDQGSIVFCGREINPANVREAEQAGITAIYQELNLVPYLTVAENIFLGHYPRKHGLIDWKKMWSDADALVRGLGISLDVRAKLNTLGTASQQMIAIARAIHIKSRLLIMDEPTSSLDSREVETLFQTIRRLREDGTSVIFISHRLDEIYRVCDQITVLKDGRFVGTYRAEEVDKLHLVELMLGHKREMIALRDYAGQSSGDIILRLSELYQAPKLNGLSLQLRRGEILGLAGLLGSGRTETAKVTFGYEMPDSGEIRFEGTRVRLRQPKDAVRLGMALCPEDRRVEGIVPNMSVRDNITLASMGRITKKGIVSRRKQDDLVKQYIEELRIKTPDADQLVKNLSGGNQQKVVLAKWLCTNPKLIILDEPTRGIDVGAKDEIARIIQKLSERGISILLISSELQELVSLCTRVVVMREGREVGELSGAEISESAIMETIASRDEKNRSAAGEKK